MVDTCRWPGLLANLHPPFTVAAATVFAGKPAPTSDRWWTHVGGRACWPISTRLSPLLPLPYSRVNPLLHRSVVDTHRGLDTGRRRSGFTREEAGPAGHLHLPSTVAAATVFAGKPAPTQIGGGHTSRVGHRPL
ncbi:hypothetical protein EQ845_00920 [Pseudomonas putida]|nr:hypothetical protein EQ845_00920 [Pseudomonas putida]